MASIRKDLAAILDKMEEFDTEYVIREALVLMAMKLAQDAGYTVGLRRDEDEKNPEEWPVHCIWLPDVGEVSWHCKARLDSWTRFPKWTLPYTGYTTAEKYQRCHEFAASVLNPTK